PAAARLARHLARLVAEGGALGLRGQRAIALLAVVDRAVAAVGAGPLGGADLIVHAAGDDAAGRRAVGIGDAARAVADAAVVVIARLARPPGRRGGGVAAGAGIRGVVAAAAAAPARGDRRVREEAEHHEASSRSHGGRPYRLRVRAVMRIHGG